MIPGFEDYTATLTEEEVDIAHTISNTMNKYHVGEEWAVTSREIAQGMLEKRGIKLTGARIRKMINYIRLNNLSKNLISSSKGYWCEPNHNRVREYTESLTQRAEAILAVARSLRQSL